MLGAEARRALETTLDENLRRTPRVGEVSGIIYYFVENRATIIWIRSIAEGIIPFAAPF
jgi:hypothetical protein